MVFQVNFNDIRARTLAEQRRVEQQELRKQKALAAKLEKARSEFAGNGFCFFSFSPPLSIFLFLSLSLSLCLVNLLFSVL